MKTNLIVLLLFIASSLFAQEAVHVKYYNFDKLEVANKESANYSRYYFPDTSIVGSSFLIKEFYKSGKPKLVGNLIIKNGREYCDGQFNYYDEKGTLIEITNFKDGYKLGKSYHFYPSRKLKKEIIYEYNVQHDISLMILESQGLYHESVCARGRVMEYLDSLGNKLVSGGNGSVKLQVNYLGEDFIEEGSFVNGLREGEWKLTQVNGSKSFIEQYDKGSLKAGKFVKNGVIKKYTTIIQAPKYDVFTYKNRSQAYGGNKVKNILNLEARLIENGFKFVRDNDQTKITVIPEFYVSFDNAGRFVNLEMITLLPKAVTDDLVKNFKQIGSFSAGIHRGEEVPIKVPFNWLMISYPNKLQ